MGEAPDRPPPAAPGDGGDETAGELSAEVEPVGTVEHFGPLTVRRFVKPDGRALILYDRSPADRGGG
jgi:hypothetical protein